ncbi:hypothetical protein PPERSA_01991 [Pseudocohnilembus persalinus]|uniref:Galactose oxidase/kelch, beta-propeller n=1 Tax=Pseudocohnilembus persalinus TaxID=266149 RepID=A0A0V0QF79_PSEPJ|nr:hypothetical protein PPERSA_01991 [Pseudocohnilembus persalinus]|eukprot:KRX00812.1 hypothetical protein PPERSA_01991 [Pseudocohnilembus persalinus]
MKKMFPVKNVDTRPLDFRINSSIIQQDNKVFIFGGINDHMQLLNSIEKYDFTTYRWEKIITKGKQPSPRHSAQIITYKDKLILIGGAQNLDIWEFDKQLKDVHILDLHTLTWSEINMQNKELPNNMALSYMIPYITNQNSQKFIYFSPHPKTYKIQTHIFDPKTYNFENIDIFSAKPDFSYKQSIIYNQEQDRIIFYGGFQYNSIAKNSIKNSIYELALFREEDPKTIKSLNILSEEQTENQKNQLQQIKDIERMLSDSINQSSSNQNLEDSNTENEMTFEQLLEIEKKNILEEQLKQLNQQIQSKQKKQKNQNQNNVNINVNLNLKQSEKLEQHLIQQLSKSNYSQEISSSNINKSLNENNLNNNSSEQIQQKEQETKINNQKKNSEQSEENISQIQNSNNENKETEKIAQNQDKNKDENQNQNEDENLNNHNNLQIQQNSQESKNKDDGFQQVLPKSKNKSLIKNQIQQNNQNLNQDQKQKQKQKEKQQTQKLKKTKISNNSNDENEDSISSVDDNFDDFAQNLLKNTKSRK